MSTNEFFYPFDPTGLASTNLVVGERQTVNPPAAMDFYYIVPKAGPYFRDSLVITLYPSGAQLQEGVDYNCTHEFMAASKATGQGVYGSITFYDHTLTGIVNLEYQTIGGDWVIDEATILEILVNVQIDPRITTWEQAVDVPYQFPPIGHEFNVDDFVGMEEVVEELNAIRAAILESGTGALTEHLSNFGNPHNVTKVQVGLGFVENYFIATSVEAQAGLINTAYMSPLRTAQAIQALAWTRIDNHAIRQDNPHSVTKSQVGLGNVDNLALSSQTEAELGASHARFMTPLRTKDAINYQIMVPFNAFVARRDNPHVVTKAQVGLGSVDDYATATKTEAELGTAPDVFMTAQRVREAVTYQVGAYVTTHLADESNPHNVTKSQVGLGSVENFPIADQVTAEAGISAVHYMTPLATRYAIQTLTDATVSAHSGLTNNPHATTKSQVGLGSVENYAPANIADAELGSASDKYMTPVVTKAAITFQALAPLNAFIDRRDNPHMVTADQVGLGEIGNYAIASTEEAELGTAADKYMNPLRTKDAISFQALAPLNTFIARRDNPHVVTAAQVGLGSVANYLMATQLEAEDGLINTAYMSPLRTKAAITAQALVPLQEFIDRRDNPHNVTAAQIGLGDIGNYTFATQAEAEAGIASDVYMSPLRTAEAISVQALVPLNTFIARRDNPHMVTKAQVGLDLVGNYGFATLQEAQDGLVTDAYMSPQRTKDAITFQALVPLQEFIDRRDNPHMVTAAQLGLGSVANYEFATREEAELGLTNDKYMSPLRTAEAIAIQATLPMNAFIARVDNPHNVTAAQVGSYTVVEINALLSDKVDVGTTAPDSTLVYGLTKIQLFAEIDDLTVANSLLLEGKTALEIQTEAQAGTSANSSKLGGQTKAEILDEYTNSGLLGANQGTISQIVPVFLSSDPLTEIVLTESWTKIATVNATTPSGSIPTSVSFIVAGGADFSAFKAAPAVHGTLVFNRINWINTGIPSIEIAEMQWMNGSAPGYDLYWRVEAGVCEIWSKNQQYRDDMVITELSDRTMVVVEDPVITDADLMITVEPVGLIQFVDKGAMASSSKLTALEDSIVAGTLSIEAL